MKQSIKLAAVAVLFSLAAGCVPAPEEPVESTLVAAAKQQVIAVAKDPDSVQFRGVEEVAVVTEVGSAPVVCGEFNAKNGYGGYTGFVRFAWQQEGGLVIASSDRSNWRVNEAVDSYCRGEMPS